MSMGRGQSDQRHHRLNTSHAYAGTNQTCTFICQTHRTVARRNINEWQSVKCRVCGRVMGNYGIRVRVPKRTASNKTWKRFFERFQPWA